MKYDARGNVVNSKLTYQEPNLASALVVKKQGTYETTVWRRGEPIDQIRTATLGDWLNVDLVKGRDIWHLAAPISSIPDPDNWCD